MDERVAAIARRELGEGTVVSGQIEAGLIHETYEVSVDGTDYVLQLAGDGQTDVLRRGLRCYGLVAGTALPVPDLVTGSVREYEGRAYTVVEKLPGTTAERDVSPERVRNAGRCLAEIHDAVRFDHPGWLRFDDGVTAAGSGDDVTIEEFDEGSLNEWRHRKVQDNAGYLQAGGLERAGRAVERLFESRAFESSDRGAVVLCHNDFSPDNLLFRDDELTGVLDFDHSYAGYRSRDVVKAANGNWMHDPTADWDVRETFYDGYRDIAALPDAFHAAEPLSRVETLAVSVGGMARMGELSGFEQEFYEERLLAAIERVPGA